MESVLVILSVLGFFAILVAAYVATLAPRVRAPVEINVQESPPPRPYRARVGTDRRSGQLVSFPLINGGVEIPADRRILKDRRRAA